MSEGIQEDVKEAEENSAVLLKTALTRQTGLGWKRPEEQDAREARRSAGHVSEEKEEPLVPGPAMSNVPTIIALLLGQCEKCAVAWDFSCRYEVMAKWKKQNTSWTVP